MLRSDLSYFSHIHLGAPVGSTAGVTEKSKEPLKNFVLVTYLLKEQPNYHQIKNNRRKKNERNVTLMNTL